MWLSMNETFMRVDESTFSEFQSQVGKQLDTVCMC